MGQTPHYEFRAFLSRPATQWPSRHNHWLQITHRGTGVTLVHLYTSLTPHPTWILLALQFTRGSASAGCHLTHGQLQWPPILYSSIHSLPTAFFLQSDLSPIPPLSTQGPLCLPSSFIINIKVKTGAQALVTLFSLFSHYALRSA